MKYNLDIMSLAKKYNDHIYNWLCTNEYSNILDFGAGSGTYCNRIKINNATALEVDEELRLQIKCQSHTNLNEIKDDSFDLIYSLNVLEHIEDDLTVMKKLTTKLKDKGIIKILVPAKMELYSQMDKNVGHYRRYEKKELIELIQDSNLELISCKYFDFVGYFASLVYKYTYNSGEIKPSSLIIYDKIIFPLSIFIDKITFGKIIGKNLMIIAKKK